MKFFISYNHSDKKLALSIAKELDKKDVNYFLDEKGIDYGDDIVDKISKNLMGSTHMAVIISPGSKKSAWVPYEIGFSRANNLKIIPILQHPAIEVPSYIRNLKYCKDIDEFRRYVDVAFEGNLVINVNISAGEMTYLDEKHVVFSRNSLKDNKVADNTVTPALIINIKNKMGKEIVLDNPSISFKKPQKGIIPDKEIEGLSAPFSLDKKHNVSPNAETTFYFYHPGNVSPQNSIMTGIINAFLTDNIELISIESNEGYKKIVRAGSISNIDKIVEYYRIRFPSYCIDLV